MPFEDEPCMRAPVDTPTCVAPKKPVVWDKAAFEELLRQGKFAKALELVRCMCKQWPDNPSLVRALALLESHVEGHRGLHRADVLFEEACQVFLRGDKEVAKRMFLTCYQMRPDAWWVRFNLSRLGMAQSTELSDAESELSDAECFGMA